MADALGTGERGRYLVAATFGNVHGTYAPGNVKLKPEILRGKRRWQRRMPPLASSTSFMAVADQARELDDAISFGVVKVNLDTSAQYAFTRGVAGHVLDHWQGVLKVDGGAG